MLYLIPIIPLVLLITAVILRRWRTGIVLIFIWLLAEDVIRRLIPGQPVYIMLIKDVLIFLTYFSFFAYIVFKNKKIWQPSFIVPLALFAAIVIIEIFNPFAPNLLFGIIGFRSYLWYMPLMFLGYHMFNTKGDLLKFCRILAYMAIPLSIFALLQYFFFDSGFALFRPFDATHSFHSFGMFGSNKISLFSSVFGSGQRFARFSMLLFFIGIGILSANKKNKILPFSIAAAFMGVVLSGSRSAFILTIFGLFLFGILRFYTKRKDDKSRNSLKRKHVNIFIVILILASIGFIAFLNRDVILFYGAGFYFIFKERIPWFIQEFTRAFSEAKIFGIGSGTMSQGMEYIPGGPEWFDYQVNVLRSGFWFESGIGRILFELGMVGFWIFYLFWASLLYKAKNIISKLQSYNLRNIGISIFIFSLLMLIWFSFLHHQVFGDATTLTILWFFIGVFFGLSRLQDVEERKNRESI